MNEAKDKQSKKNFINKKVILFYLILFLIALISGTFFNLILNDNDNKLVIDYLNNFLLLIKNNNINYLYTFINTLSMNYLYIFIIWILGYTIIGIPIIIVIYFFKSFILGFSLSALISNFKIKGILYSFVYLFPHTITNLIIILILSVISIYISVKMIEMILKKKKVNFNIIIKKYFIILLIFLLISLITALYEALLLPKVFNLLI